MSLFLFYFDDGPLDDLAGTRSSIVLRPIPQVVRYKGAVLTRSVVAITDGVASESFRDASGAMGSAMHRDLALLVVERLLRSHTPRLVFHRDRGDDSAIDATVQVQLAVLDLCVRVTRVEAAGRSGPQAHAGHAVRSGNGTAELTGAEGDVGNLGALLAILPCDTLVTVTGPPRAGADRSVGRRKRSKF